MDAVPNTGFHFLTDLLPMWICEPGFSSETTALDEQVIFSNTFHFLEEPIYLPMATATVFLDLHLNEFGK